MFPHQKIFEGKNGEKKPEQRPVGTIPVYVAGLALILIIVCYFYYQDGKKETKTLYFAQKEQPKIKTYPVYRDSVPSDDTGDQQGMFPQPSETPRSSLPIKQESLIKESKELVDKEPIKGQAETVILLSKAALNIAVEKAPSLSKESTHVIIESEGAVLSAEQKDLKVFKEKAPVKESAPVRKREVTKLKEKAPVAKVEEEQQPISLPPVVPVSKDDPSTPDKKEAVSPRDKQTLDTQVNEDTAIKLQQLDSNVAQLTRAVVASDEKNQADYQPLTLSHVEKRKLNTVQVKTQPDSYNVSLHYTSEKNKELMEYLAILLQLEGFGVFGIEKVDYQDTDIRYFHSEDKAGALLLQKYSTEFITPFMHLEDTNIKIKDLGQKYPNARKGALELWVNNKFLR
jgi:hypothetical protein